MGLSATNARLLAFTSRKHDITGMQMHYSNQKMALSRDMQRVSRNYQNALNSKIYKWSNNGGVSYSTLSYNNLMRPSTMNQNKAYLLTDLAGRVVIDSKYKEYAEMITANGGYDNCRNELLSKATGISVETLEQVHNYHDQIYKTKIEIDSYNEKPDPSRYSGLQEFGIEGLLSKINFSGTNCSGASFSAGSNWAEAYDKNATINFKLDNFVISTLGNELFEGIKNFLDPAENQEKMNNAFIAIFGDNNNSNGTTFLEQVSAGKIDLSTLNSPLIKKDGNTVKLNVRELINQILGAYFNEGGDSREIKGYGASQQDIIWYNTDTEIYNEYKNDLNSWQKGYDELINTYNQLNSKSGQLLTSEQEQLINFYDEIFSSIAEKGWVYNNCVTDDEYLNQMLQNNMYTITEINRRHICDGEEKEHYYVNDYIEDVAGNMPKLYQVADEEAILEAQVEYENEKAIINEKETRIDLRMDTLKTELDAINTMMKSMEKIKKENIDRTMNITG